jgi:hypothetical protein
MITPQSMVFHALNAGGEEDNSQICIDQDDRRILISHGFRVSKICEGGDEYELLVCLCQCLKRSELPESIHHWLTLTIGISHLGFDKACMAESPLYDSAKATGCVVEIALPEVLGQTLAPSLWCTTTFARH